MEGWSIAIDENYPSIRNLKRRRQTWKEIKKQKNRKTEKEIA